jgi:putative transposase
MTEDRMALFDLIDQSADDDLVRDMLAFAAGRMMEMEVEARTGAASGARSADRKTYRNGYRERGWDTRAGGSISTSRSCARAPTFRLP